MSHFLRPLSFLISRNGIYLSYVDCVFFFFKVEAILDDKKIKNSVQYLIRWKGYSSGDDTWEPERTLNCTDLLQKYKEAKAKKKKAAEEEEEEDDGKEYEVNTFFIISFINCGIS